MTTRTTMRYPRRGAARVRVAVKQPPGVPEGMKRCPADGAVLPLSEFYRVKAAGYAGGYRYSAYCRTHEIERRNARKRTAPPDSPSRLADRAASRRYAERNRETVLAKQRVKSARYYDAHRDEIKARQKRYREANAEREAERKRRWYERKKAGGDEPEHPPPSPG